MASLNPDRLPSQYLYDRFGREHGLPSDTVWIARQGPEGYLWLGTKNGLARFDGVRFTIFNKQNQTAFRSNDIRDIEVAADGSLWLATYGGGVLHFAGGEFTALTTADGLADDIVHDVYLAPDGAVWFATGFGVSRLQAGKLQSWNMADGLTDNRTFRIHADGTGGVWIATLTNGLSHFDGTNFNNFSEGSGLDSTQVHLLFADPEFGLIATTITGTTYRLTAQGPVVHESASLQQKLPVHAAIRDRDGSLWLGTYGRGLWRLGSDGALQQFTLTTERPGYVFELLEDREGNIWASTMHGIYRLRDSSFLHYGQPEGLAEAIFVVTQSPLDDAIWAGSEGSGLFRLATDGTVSRFDMAGGLSNNNVSALLAEADGTVWAGTFGGGLNRIGSDGAISHFTVQDGLPNNHIMGLQRDREGKLWVVTDGGMGTLDEAAGSFQLREDLPGTVLRQITEDQLGRLWLTSNSGLIQLAADTITVWDESTGLGSDLVSTTYVDAEGVVWVGSRESGLARLEGEELFQFSSEHGLPQLSVLAILEDDAGRLWMSGADGLASIARADLNAVARGDLQRVSAQLYTEADGLRSAQFLGGFQPAGWRARDGRLWFASNRGLVALAPGTFEQRGVPGKPILEQVRVNGKPVALANPLRLPPGASGLEVDYTVPRLGAPHTLQFRYRLEGFDQDWHRVGSRRTAYFTGLTAGQKTLRVVATDNQGADDLTAEEATLVIVRAPFWYQTWWFRVLAVLGALLLASGLYYAAGRQALRRQRRLERLVDRRTRELQIALNRVEEISRTDSLTGVANRRFLDEILDSAWQQCAQQHAPVSALMLDIDYFKQYNDSAGHVAGDKCLRQVAEALQSGVLRDEDVVVRYGGEEFLALLPGADARAVASVAERIQRLLRGLEITHPDSPVSPFLTASLGCATAWPAEAGTPDDLIRSADAALYQAKSRGRDRIAVSGEA
ncbi:MAG: diguanylate cyclase [Haliea sp.]|uniref:diguanylate cyclase n=1 Tax=Haliea sp. TaxID=1932666 RepID=UPI0032EF63AB